VINRRNGCGTTLLKKGLTENMATFDFESLILNLFCRDQTAQRLWVNGCGSTVAGQCFCKPSNFKVESFCPTRFGIFTTNGWPEVCRAPD